MSTQRSPSRSRETSPLIAAALGAGLAVGATIALRRRRPPMDRPQANLASYLTDHLAGSDTALAVVTRLSSAREGTPDRALFERLTLEFAAERDVVRSVLRQLGASGMSMKRVVGQTAGAMLQAAAGREEGTLSYFRTLESLIVGVQGKRCLWRALGSLEIAFDDATSFGALEQQALDQWHDLEEARQRQLSLVFGASD